MTTATVSPAAIAQEIVSHGGPLLNKWKQFGDNLCTQDNTLRELDLDYKKSFYDRFFAIIDEYVRKQENGVTLASFCDVLENLDAVSTAQSLKRKWPLAPFIQIPGRPVPAAAPTQQVAANQMIQGEVGSTTQTDSIPIIDSTPQRPANNQSSIPSQLTSATIPNQDVVDFAENIIPLKVSIVRTGKVHEGNSTTYSVNSNPRGLTLIMNNIKFKNHLSLRKGAENDSMYLETLFEQLNYDVTLHQNVSSKKTLNSYLTLFKDKFDEQKVDSCVVVLCSHGTRDKAYMSNGDEIDIWEDLVYQFDHINCPALKNIPKIFIIQACQGSRTWTDSSAEIPKSIKDPRIGDMMVCFSTLPLYVSNRDIFLGTWYIYTLTKVIMENAHDMDFEEMLKKVQRTPTQSSHGAQQISTWHNLLFNKFYFNPI